jgi:hypothetical protein
LPPSAALVLPTFVSTVVSGGWTGFASVAAARSRSLNSMASASLRDF